MKKMKKVVFLCLIGLLFLPIGCKDKCELDIPQNVKPIDWEGYNDVYTVYWNYRTLISETNKKIDQDRGKEIMVYGWVCFPHSVNFLFGLSEFYGNGLICDIEVQVPMDTTNNLIEQVYSKLDTSDVSKKCFIKGKLSDSDIIDECYWLYPRIVITDVDDIYFEE